jgi:glycerophosphoryl diester phosphodiesterase
VTGHRGASGHRPRAHARGLQASHRAGGGLRRARDRVHQGWGAGGAPGNEISTTTDVASHPEFADRRTTKKIDGIAVSGQFTEDFTLAELRTLRAVERLPQLRGTSFDGRSPVPTLQEVIDLVEALHDRLGRRGAPAPRHLVLRHI